MRKSKLGGFGPIAGNQELRTQLQQSIILDSLTEPDGPRVIGVCGCQPDSGATSVALGLAIMLQERTTQNVLLIEANLRSAKLRKAYGLEAGPGFRDAVLQTTKLEDCLVKIPGSEMSGILADNSSSPLRDLDIAVSRVPEIATGFRHTIIDCPPVNLYPDIGILAPSIDGVLLVLEAEETRWQVAIEARKRIESAGGKLLGAVLNRKTHYIPSWIYRLL